MQSRCVDTSKIYEQETDGNAFYFFPRVRAFNYILRDKFLVILYSGFEDGNRRIVRTVRSVIFLRTSIYFSRYGMINLRAPFFPPKIEESVKYTTLRHGLDKG